MKKISSIIFSLLFIASCASNGEVSQWQGESLSDLIAEYGKPDTFLKLSDGNRVVEYDRSTSQQLAGNFCSVTFIVDSNNHIFGVQKIDNGSNCVAQ